MDPQDQSQQQQQQHVAQAHAARFYMQHRRQGSNTSLDSASHFIDHRNQQPIGIPAPLSPSSFRHTPGRASVSGRGDLSNMHPSSLHPGSLFNASALDDGEEILSPRSYVRNPSSNGQMGSSMSAHGPPLRTPHRTDRLVDVDDDEQTHAALSPTHVPHTPSRRSSSAQDDVCFPMPTPGVEHMDFGSGVQEGSHGPQSFDPVVAHSQTQAIDHAAVSDSKGLPPGFPWTFDLGALEDYAEQERRRVHEEAVAPSSPTWVNGLRNRSGAATIGTASGLKRSPINDISQRSLGFGQSPDSDDATFYSRRPRHLPTPINGERGDGKNTGRYQRKLAIFEGVGASPPPIENRSTGNILGGGALLDDEMRRHRLSTSHARGGPSADVKTPLLDGSGRSTSYQGMGGDGSGPYQDDVGGGDRKSVSRVVSVGADLSNLGKRNRGGHRSMRPGPGGRSASQERPYRFTFYSNALPNTIHARHLYELPAPGQTFEELLTGVEPRPAPQEDDTAAQSSSRNDANGPAANQDNGAASGSQRTSFGQHDGDKPISALTSALLSQNGRLEGSTAPNTGRNTPDLTAANVRTAAQAGRVSTSSGPGTALPGATSTTATMPAATMEKARALPGGGYRVEQDPDTCTWWLDVLCPTDQEMKTLSRVFGIHPLTTEDILMEETREKIELFRNYYLVCFRSFDQDPYSPTYLEPLNMYVIVFREGTLSFHFRATPHPQNVRRRIKQLKDYINVTSDWISYALIDDITDAFGPLIQSIEYEVDSIDELVLILKEAEQSDMLRRIGTCRKKVMGLLRLMGNKADVVKCLAKRCNENWSVAPKSDIGLYLSDIQDHLITMTQNLNHYEKILSRSHSNYLAQISIEMTDANNQINDVLSKLTALGTVIVPLNVITGLWGMNVNVPGQGVESLDWFFGIIAVMVALAVIGYFATIRYLSR